MNYFSNKYDRIPLFDVATIGAGSAGISNCKELNRKGIRNQIVIEARPYIGGRAITHPRYGDLAAAGFHMPTSVNARNSATFDIINFAENNNFSFASDDKNFLAFIDGKQISSGKVDRAFLKIDEAFSHSEKLYRGDESLSNISLYEAFHSGLAGTDQKPARLLKSIMRTIYSAADAGLDPKDIPFRDFLNTTNGMEGIYPDKGMGTLIQRYARDVEKFVALEQEVTGFFYEAAKNRWRIEYFNTKSGNQTTIHAKKLVLTQPIGVLQKIKSSSHNLPDSTMTAINNIKMGYMNKIIIEMDDRFFTGHNLKDFTHINIRSNRLDEDMIFLARPHGKNIIVGFTGGNTALKLERAGKSAAVNFACDILKTAFGEKSVHDSFLSAHATQWNADKYSLGSYTARTDEGFHHRLELAKPTFNNSLFFAGEFYPDQEFQMHSHITGAIRSGVITANHIAKDLLKQNHHKK